MDPNEPIELVDGADPDRGIVAFLKQRQGILDFVATMREQGIHVGLGHPGVCVTCDQPWPCPDSMSARRESQPDDGGR